MLAINRITKYGFEKHQVWTFFFEDKGSDKFLKGNLVCLIRQTNVCKLRNCVLLSLFACFQDGRQNYTESYIVVDSLLNVPRNICGSSVLAFVLYCISLCSFYFC